MSTTYTIYALVDPRDGRVRYVGCTEQPLWQRMRGHRDSGTAEKRAWHDVLLLTGLHPLTIVLQVLETADRFQSHKAEWQWIERFRDAGAELFNVRSPDGYRTDWKREEAQG